MARARKIKAPLTTAQQLSALIKSARDILRKDKGLNGDIDRLPMLTWVMFLKFLDDLETLHEEEAALDGLPYEPIIEPPYRWRDWAAREDGISGDELLAFINQESAVLSDGSTGPGLFHHLHTIVRLPQGVFAPYTDIPANLVFFDRSGPTGDIWFYELPPPQGRKKYSKTAPIQFEEFSDCLAWWKEREENAQAWQIDFAALKADVLSRAEPLWKQADAERQAAAQCVARLREIDLELAALNGEGVTSRKKLALQKEQTTLKARQQAHDDAAKAAQKEGDGIYWPIYNLDLKNPNGREKQEHVPPEVLVARMIQNEREAATLLAELAALVGEDS